MNEKILVIDDDQLTTAMLEDMLKTQNYLTRSALDGKKGIEAIKEWQPDVVLLDIVMPEMDGFAVAKAIREMKLPSRPSIIIISAKGERETIVSALSSFADDFIVKPVDELELIARIKAQIRIGEFYRELEEDKNNLETILGITNIISATLSTEVVLDTIVEKTAVSIGAVRCSIVLIGGNSEGYVLTSSDNPEVKNLKLNLRKYPEIQEVIKTKSALSLENITEHPLMEDVREFIKDLKDMSILVLPIVFNEKVLGTLFLRARRENKGFSKKEIAFCQIIANSSYYAIKNAKLYEDLLKEKEKLNVVAITDHLTSLYNHNFFYMRLDEEFERSMRYSTDLSLIMMDIDDFKRINDGYGHRTGDVVLKEIAGILKKSVRKSDVVSRYGGEEFAVILPHTPIKGALEEAERIRKVIGEHCLAGLIKETITMSVGVASYPNGTTIMNSGDLVNCADKALYRAKLSGKNRVGIYEG